ncbi:MAG: hypothetical protein AAF799_14120 [Myxococcota bacterium]
MTIALAIAVASWAVPAAADSVDCADSDNWEKTSKKKIKEGTKAYLGGDVLDEFQDSDLTDEGHKMFLGFKGSASAAYWGLPLFEVGDEDGGLCTSGDDCMEICQALCCMAEGCTQANLQRDEIEKNYLFYVESGKAFYCKLWQIDDKKNKNEEWSLCEMRSSKSSAASRSSCETLTTWLEDELEDAGMDI